MNYFKRFIFGSLGMTIVAFTVAIIIRVNIGLYPPESLNMIMVDFFGIVFNQTISLSLITLGFNLAFLGLLVLVRLKTRTLSVWILKGLIPIFLFSIPLGFFYDWLGVLYFNHATLDYPARFVIFILSFFISNFGNAMYQVSNIANFPMNDFTEEWGKVLHTRFAYIRIGLDTLVILLTLLMYFSFNLPNPYVGWMTLFLIIFSGPSIDFFLVFLRKKIQFK